MLEVIGNGDSFWKSILSVKMQYNSLLFFVFFLLFLCVFFLCRDGKKKQICILAGNIIFYVWAGWQPMLIVLGSGLIAFFTTLKIEKIYSRYEGEKEELSPKEQVALFNGYKKKARKHLILGMVLLFGVWILVKLGKLLGFATVTTFAAMYERSDCSVRYFLLHFVDGGIHTGCILEKSSADAQFCGVLLDNDIFSTYCAGTDQQIFGSDREIQKDPEV